jgi:hypothetical protein
MASNQSNRRTRAWVFFALKWIFAPLAILIFGFVAVLTVLEASRDIPVPQMVLRVQAEQELRRRATEDPSSSAENTSQPVSQPSMASQIGLDGENARDSESLPSSASNAQAVDLSEPLIVETPDMPEEARAKRQSLNASFAELEKRLAAYEKTKEEFRYWWEGHNCLIKMSSDSHALWSEIFVECNRIRRNPPVNDQLLETMEAAMKRINGEWWIRLHDASLENLVRHQHWLSASEFARDWDERIYYLQQEGGVFGTLGIAGAIAERDFQRLSEKIQSVADWFKH